MEPQSVEAMAPVLSGCFLVFIILTSLVSGILSIVIFCKIYSRAGYPWAMGFLMLIPVVNFIMMLILAFSEWPIQKQVKQLQQQLASQGGQNQNFRGM